MAKIIWKGIDSTSIKGLLISELPPIIKPRMSIEETKIDGVDGSIIEELGYESYEKTLIIGLFGNFDIDEIIKYFSGSGNIVFSNEPNKYYKARILEQIDYEKLLRFKTAEITFYVQPYKYALDEENVALDINTETEISVNNIGLEKSKPIFHLYGEGLIEISINGYTVFQIIIDDEYVTIDSEEENAHKASILKNNKMLGEFPMLEVGLNQISWTGTLTRIEIEPKSRWL